jgi:hypothetical protein
VVKRRWGEEEEGNERKERERVAVRLKDGRREGEVGVKL